MKEKVGNAIVGSSKANAVSKPNKANRAKKDFSPEKDHDKFKDFRKPNRECFVYGKPGH